MDETKPNLSPEEVLSNLRASEAKIGADRLAMATGGRLINKSLEMRRLAGVFQAGEGWENPPELFVDYPQFRDRFRALVSKYKEQLGAIRASKDYESIMTSAEVDELIEFLHIAEDSTKKK